ncbi:DUF4199 domain-containing protein [Reichenbachiella agariperforans]|uniref:DUF4199 domain-containing protein n=1 Tax=Reichenbachiella agariperforans TaxID=156994 RepID=UPI001C08BA3B|nr:DUF4199 domain-containing protein [Reichenbachiella agariperforans]MBU2914420.1 DUF4199 domain-containing protein [Reichenbachiella agariperforans]
MRDLFRISLRYGLIGSALIIIMFMVFYFSGENPLQELQMFDLFIIPIFIFFGLKEYRDRYNGHLLQYWQGMTAGSIVYLTIGFVTALFMYVFIQFDTDLISEHVAIMLKGLEDTQTKIVEEMGANSYIESYEKVKATTASDVILDSLVKKIIIGFLITSVASVVLKRKQLPITKK